jgi:outer membrane protein assembly factor BamB
MSTTIRLALLGTALFFVAAVAAAEEARRDDPDNWPRWRGPRDDGSNEGGGAYPVKWDDTAGVLWKAPLPGKGCSTPIVWDRRIYLTAPVDGQDAVVALDWSGNQLWRTPLGPETAGKHRNGSGSNASPATDGRTLFAYFKSGNLAALEFDGAVRWKTNLWQQFGGQDTLYWDAGSSPVLTEKDVVVAVMQNGGSYLAAFDKQTGELHWKVARDYETPTEGDHSYATPAVIRHDGREAILVWGAEHLTAHDAADGSVLWSCGDFNPTRQGNWPAVGSAVVVGDVAVVPYARGDSLTGVRLGDDNAKGDVTNTHKLWVRQDTGTFVPTPAAYKGKVYLVRDRGEVECIDPKTGKTAWSGQLPKSSASYYSSPSLADGKIYAAREDGVVFVARVEGGTFEVLAENEMDERIIACPVPVAGRLLLRGEQNLYCVGAE